MLFQSNVEQKLLPRREERQHPGRLHWAADARAASGRCRDHYALPAWRVDAKRFVFGKARGNLKA